MGDETIWWIGGAAVVAPYLISYLKAADWPAQRQRIFALVMSVVLGVVAYGSEHGFDALTAGGSEGIVTTAVAVWALGQLVYSNLVSGTALEGTLSTTRAGLLPA